MQHQLKKFNYIYHTKENWIIENIGLDAVMFLRFLLMGFYICLAALIFIFPVLTAVHYVAPNGEANERVIITPDIIVEISPITLDQFSIINVPSGSSIFYLHVVYAYFLTASLKKLLSQQKDAPRHPSSRICPEIRLIDGAFQPKNDQVGKHHRTMVWGL